jgi:hypothetical protein
MFHVVPCFRVEEAMTLKSVRGCKYVPKAGWPSSARVASRLPVCLEGCLYYRQRQLDAVEQPVSQRIKHGRSKTTTMATNDPMAWLNFVRNTLRAVHTEQVDTAVRKDVFPQGYQIATSVSETTSSSASDVGSTSYPSSSGNSSISNASSLKYDSDIANASSLSDRSVSPASPVDDRRGSIFFPSVELADSSSSDRPDDDEDRESAETFGGVEIKIEDTDDESNKENVPPAPPAMIPIGILLNPVEDTVTKARHWRDELRENARSKTPIDNTTTKAEAGRYWKDELMDNACSHSITSTNNARIEPPVNDPPPKKPLTWIEEMIANGKGQGFVPEEEHKWFADGGYRLSEADMETLYPCGYTVKNERLVMEPEMLGWFGKRFETGT